MSNAFKRKAFFMLISLLLLTLFLYGNVSSVHIAHAASTITINGSTHYQTIDGFGFSDAFGPADALRTSSASEQKQILDLLLNTSNGAGFTILRNLLPSDASHTIEPTSPGSPNATPHYVWDGSSWGQVWLAQQAKSYGVKQFYGDAWSAPGFMKTNGSEVNGGAVCGVPNATCRSGDWRQAYANYLAQYINDYQSAGIPLTQIGYVNEPNLTTSYSSMVMNPAQTANLATVLGPTLKNAGLHQQIVCCEPEGWNLAQSYASAITSNATANSYVNVISSHGYIGPPNSALSGTGSKHIWETEWSTFENWDPNWDDGGAASGFVWAKNVYTGLTASNLSAFLYWWGVGFNSSDNGALIHDNNGTVLVSKRLWALANYSRFIHPGATRIGANTGDNNLQVTAFSNTDGSLSVVVLNTASSPTAVSLSLQNTSVGSSGVALPYLTNSSNSTAVQASLPISNGAFNTTIPARSLITYKISKGSSTGSGYYKIVNRNSGQVLDMNKASTANGGAAIQWPYQGGTNQQWQEVRVNGGYKLVNRNSGKVLDDPGASKSSGTQLDQWSDTNGSNQWWNLVSAGNGYYYLVNQSSGLYAGVSGSSTANGAPVVQGPGNGGTSLQWQIVAV